MTQISVKVDQETATAAEALLTLLEMPAGADIRHLGTVSRDTLERTLNATGRLYLAASTLLSNARTLRPNGLPSSEYTFEILNADGSVAAHAVVKWYAGDANGARSAAIAQSIGAGKFDPEAQRMGAAPIKEVPAR